MRQGCCRSVLSLTDMPVGIGVRFKSKDANLENQLQCQLISRVYLAMHALHSLHGQKCYVLHAPKGWGDKCITRPNKTVASVALDSMSTQATNGSAEDLRYLVNLLKEDEDRARAKREQLELQLMRLEQQDRIATRQAQLAQPSGAGGSGSIASLAGSNPYPSSKKKVLRKSKRMTAMAAAAGMLRVQSPVSSPRPSRSPDNDKSHEQPESLDLAVSEHQALGLEDDSTSLPASELLERLQAEDNPALSERLAGNIDDSNGDKMCTVPKPIFVISDCTGESAARTVRAALNQFELCFKTSAPATILVFRFVEDERKAYNIIETAAKEDALVIYTLVNPAALKAVATACKLLNVRNVDLWSNLLDCMEAHLDATRSGVPMINAPRRPALSEDYFKMIEAVEYTRKMDDGANPKEWKSADLLVLGVSRCGKTPLSIFLGQRGFKVANLPLVPCVPLPRELYEIDQTRIVGLTIDPNVLLSIRRNRLGMMGVKDFGMPIDYAEIQKINSELNWARQLYASNPDWPVLDVTLRGVEETAARILKILNDKRGDASPQWVEELYGKMGSNRPATSGSLVARNQMGMYRAAEQSYMGGEQYLVEGLY